MRIVKRILKGLEWRLRYRTSFFAAKAFKNQVLRKKRTFARLTNVQRRILEHIPRLGAIQAGRLPYNPTISVVIPHYNQQDVLGFTLDSVLAQTIRPEEILVVDDQSTDIEKTARIEKEYVDYPQVKFIYAKQKLFAGGARNLGARSASGDIIAFIDSDDIMHPQRLEFVLDAFRKHPDTVFLLTGMVPFSETIPTAENFELGCLESRLISPGELLENTAKGFESNRLSFIDPVSKQIPWYAWGSFGVRREYLPHTGALNVRRHVFDTFGFNSPKNYVFCPYEDYEFCLFLHAMSNAGRQIDLPLVFYRRGFTTCDPVRHI